MEPPVHRTAPNPVTPGAGPGLSPTPASSVRRGLEASSWAVSVAWALPECGVSVIVPVRPHDPSGAHSSGLAAPRTCSATLPLIVAR